MEGASSRQLAPIEGSLQIFLSFDDLRVNSDIIMNYEDSRIELRAMGHNLVRVSCPCIVIRKDHVEILFENMRHKSFFNLFFLPMQVWYLDKLICKTFIITSFSDICIDEPKTNGPREFDG